MWFGSTGQRKHLGPFCCPSGERGRDWKAEERGWSTFFYYYYSIPVSTNWSVTSININWVWWIDGWMKKQFTIRFDLKSLFVWSCWLIKMATNNTLRMQGNILRLKYVMTMEWYVVEHHYCFQYTTSNSLFGENKWGKEDLFGLKNLFNETLADGIFVLRYRRHQFSCPIPR